MQFDPAQVAGYLIVAGILVSNLVKLWQWNNRREKAEKAVAEELAKTEKLRRAEFVSLSEQVGGVNERLDRQNGTIKEMKEQFDAHVIEGVKQQAWMMGKLGEPLENKP